MLGLFSGKKPDHPLADAKEAKRLLGELPGAEPLAAIDEAAGWLDSVTGTDGFGAEQRFAVVAQIDEAVILHARRLAREYVGAERMSRLQERKIWQINESYWTLLAEAYRKCLDEAETEGKGAVLLKSPLLYVRLLHAGSGRLKWSQFRYRPLTSEAWATAGRAYLGATAGGLEKRAVALYPGTETSSTAEYLKMLVFQASAVDSLTPRDIEIAERLVAHFLPVFVLTAEVRPDNVYWVDAGKSLPPTRLAKLPEVTPTLRFFNTGAAAERVANLRTEAKAQGDVPAEVNLGGRYPLEAVLPVLDHLALCWAPTPPMRGHVRHRVKSRLTVVHGLDTINRVLVAPMQLGEGAETWFVDDVSMGGLGAQVPLNSQDWVRVGALLAMRPEGGENWLLGIVRRFVRSSDAQGAVGIETLSKTPYAVVADSSGLIVDAIVLDPPQPGTIVRVLLAEGSWDARAALHFSCAGTVLKLSPAGVVERSADHVVGRYTLST